MKLFPILLFLACFSCASETKDSKKQIDSKPQYEVAVTFLNSYIDFLNDRSLEMGSVRWVQTQPTVTSEFKSELARFKKEAEFLDFDPILDAQDYPEGFEIDKSDSVFVTVKGIDWPEFKLTLKIDKQGNHWLVDGSGVINVPEDRRVDR